MELESGEGQTVAPIDIPLRTWWWQRPAYLRLCDDEMVVHMRQFWGGHDMHVPKAGLALHRPPEGLPPRPVRLAQPVPLRRPPRVPRLMLRGAFGKPNLFFVCAPPVTMPRLLFPGAGSQIGITRAESRRAVELDGWGCEAIDPVVALATLRFWCVREVEDGDELLAESIGTISNPVEADALVQSRHRLRSWSRVSLAVTWIALIAGRAVVDRSLNVAIAGIVIGVGALLVNRRINQVARRPWRGT